MPIDGITIHEGYNDLGTFEVDITDVKQEASAESMGTGTSQLPISRKLLFKLQFDGPTKVPITYLANFTAEGLISSEDFTYPTLNPNSDGFIEIETPVFPVVNIDTEYKVIRYKVSGPLDARTEECYLEVEDNIGGTMFTLITDFVVDDGKLCVTDGNDNYFPITPNIPIDPGVAIHITKTGEVFEYDTDEWVSDGSLLFHMFPYPENLTSISDGFYDASTAGTPADGNLGDAMSPFEDFYGDVINPEVSFVDITLVVFPKLGVGPAYSGTIENLLPGGPKFTPVTLSGSPPAPVDDSPTWGDIETITGISFSMPFESFLTTKSLNTVDILRKAGPMTYIEDFPEDATEEEVQALQAHVDFYSINQDAEQNQLMLAADYFSIFDIANTPKSVFLEDVVDDEDFPLFKAAQVHEVAVQNQKLVSNLLSSSLTDLRLVSPTTPAIANSTFVDTALAENINTCGCSDCKSGVSPFAYLMDLLRYGAAHINHSTSPVYYAGGNVPLFIGRIADEFKQPFGTMNVSCDTLHDEFCRVRLVTEVLEKLVPSEEPAQLTNERNQFLLLVYKSILAQAGTSIEEVRDVKSMQPDSVKLVAAKKLADKLNIPLYDPEDPEVLTTDKLWLTIGNTVTAHKLDLTNIEAIFGFRSTKRNVLTVTPVSKMEKWHAAYLRDKWKPEDYLFSAYSREDVDPDDDDTFKPTWKPIVDPDIMCWTDLTYVNDDSAYPLQKFIKDLWKHRKGDVDTFLSYVVADYSTTTLTQVDMTHRVLRVLGVDITGQTILDHEIQIEHPLTFPPTWNTYDIFDLQAKGSNTEVILKKSTQDAPQPEMLQPISTMHYKRVVLGADIDDTDDANPILTWVDPVVKNLLTTGYAKLVSTASVSPNTYEKTDPPVTNKIVSITVNDEFSVTLNVDPPLDPGFKTGDITFTYEVEVPLYGRTVPDPEKLVTQLFDYTQDYNLLATAPASLTDPLEYTVWDEPTWPGIIDADTDYGKLKQVQYYLGIGTEVTALTTIITDNLYMSTSQFARMMSLFKLFENYLSSMYTAKEPTEDDIYELASILRNCAKTPLRSTWVAEEILHLDPSTDPFNLQLKGQYFWKSITEPKNGPWDQRLQNGEVPVLDPDLLARNSIVPNPEADTYRTTYDSRVTDLQGKYDEYAALAADPDTNPDAFIKMLNEIATGSTATSYETVIDPPYATLQDLIDALKSNNSFTQNDATLVLWNAFKITRADFLEFIPVKENYESDDSSVFPSQAK